MPDTNTRAASPLMMQSQSNFYGNETIKKISEKPRWTISDTNKRPIDMYEWTSKHAVKGCDIQLEGSTMTLKELDAIFADIGVPDLHTFYLDVMEDDIVILDVEPACPDAIKRRILTLPYLYGEVSMSGKGLHLAFPKPKNFDEFENAAKKVALKDGHGYYEILLNHWITFTGRTLEMPIAKNVENQTDFEEFYAKIASIQKSSEENEVDFEFEDISIADIPESDYIIELLTTANHYPKRPSNFNGDMSSYEYGWFCYKYRRMRQILKLSRIIETGHDYTPQEQACMLREIARIALPKRDKHETWNLRGMSWLTYLAKTVVARKSNESPYPVKEGERHG